MSQFFISCKESRIESNRSFYGCFYLGPFEPNQSITIANALRRTLLSDLYGLAIVSVEIDGASHEYASLPGVRDSVLDILLNIKEIILKKTIKNFKPQMGYLRVCGPGVVRASHLRLPAFIQCVDPNQYIATLAENGFLNMKFVIQYGNKWLSSYDLGEKAKEFDGNEKRNKYGFNPFNSYLKKRRLILKKLKNVSLESDSLFDKNQYLKMLHKSSSFLKKISKKKQIPRKRLALQHLLVSKYPGINFKKNSLKKVNKFVAGESTPNSQGLILGRSIEINKREENGIKKMIFLNSKPLIIDAIFNPINKVNYIIESNDFKDSPSKLRSSSETDELYEMLNTNSSLLTPQFNEDNFKVHSEINSVPSNLESEITQHEIENILELKRDINNLTKESLKHNITIEIWTNGSIHPRDALYQGFKNLIQLFSKLNKTNSFGVSNFDLQNNSNLDFFNHFNKKSKMGELTTPLFQDLIALNEVSFLGTYTDPKLKSYYLNNPNLNEIIKNPLFKSEEMKAISLSLIDPKNSKVLPIHNENRLYKADIGILSLSLRTYTTLKRFKINTIQQLIKLSKKDLLKMSQSNTWKINLSEIEMGLKKVNLNLT